MDIGGIFLPINREVISVTIVCVNGKQEVTVTKSYSRGWEIYYDGKDWRYSDNHQIVDDSRPCKRCGRMPTKEGYDACLGHIDGAKSACCGHGVEEAFVMK